MTDLYPLRLPPSFRERIWGAYDLAPVFGRQEKKIGEVWYSFDENVIANGPLQGQSLSELIQRHGPALMGAAHDGSSFPILAKLLFTSDRLSVQVHPKDDYAQAHEGSPGKTEMWHVLAAEPGAGVALGLTKTLSQDELRHAAESGEIENDLNWVEVHPGQTIFVPAGTLHAIGPGLVLCEIQQNSDVTYRFYDFARLDGDGKPRELHIDKAVEVTEQKPHPGPIAPFRFPGGDYARELLIACPYFAAERWVWEQSISYPRHPDHADLLIFLRGEGRIGDDPYAPGDAYWVPAGLEGLTLTPSSPSEVIVSHVPDLDVVRAELAAVGAGDAHPMVLP
ncbi:MAG: class I mannose-6-phosphate isomerase [Acidobacteria bacterium]|nr:class I mannose-6-phosphate isomerase [Acidobacteriota bacterium]